MKHGKNGDKTALVVQKTKILLVVIPEIRGIVSFSEIKDSFGWPHFRPGTNEGNFVKKEASAKLPVPHIGQTFHELELLHSFPSITNF